MTTHGEFEPEEPVPFEEKKKRNGKSVNTLVKNSEEEAKREAQRVADRQLEELEKEAKEGTHPRDRKAITIQTTREQHELLREKASKAGTTLNKLILRVLEPYMTRSKP